MPLRIQKVVLGLIGQVLGGTIETKAEMPQNRQLAGGRNDGPYGQPYTVKYQMLVPMLLNELQKEHAAATTQQDELQIQLQQIEGQRQEIDDLKLHVRQQNLSLQLQNASLQERLLKLESYVATQTQVKTATNIQPATTVVRNGSGQ